MELLVNVLLGQDVCVTLLIAVMLAVVASRMRVHPWVSKAGIATGFAAGIADAWLIWETYQPTTVRQLLFLTVVSLIVGFLGIAVGWIVFGCVDFIAQHTVVPLREAWEREKARWEHRRQAREYQKEVERERAARVAQALAGYAEAERKARDEEERARRNQPPPPKTPEQQMDEARARYEVKLKKLETAGLDEIELNAAKEKAKQQMLRDLDEAMK